jgi:FtsH-binding integral membrane protein
MALVGQVIGVVVNIFWLNETLYWLTTATGILLFTALTAYDVQKLKQYDPPGRTSTSSAGTRSSARSPSTWIS